MRFLFLLILLSLPNLSYALTLQEGIAKCKAMSVEERKESSLCQKVIAKIREIKAKKEKTQSTDKVTPVKQLASTKTKEVDVEKLEKIKNKCQKLTPPNQYKYKVCHQFMSQSNDPFLGKEKDSPAQYSTYLGYSLLGNIQGFELEVERRNNHLGLGLFYAQQKISDLENNEVSGSAFGASFRYHLTPLYFTKRQNVNFAGFVQLGMTSYESTIQGKLPSYFYVNMGFDASVPITKIGNSQLNGFGKIGITHIYHPDSDFLSLGSSGVLGLKLDF
jgi:hypothetical protein